MDWVTKGIKLAKRWLIPEDGMVNKIAFSQRIATRDEDLDGVS